MEQKKYYTYENKFVQNLPTALTFDDVLLVPQHSEVESRSQCIVKSWFSKNIPLNVPIVSSPMDTVTEWELAKEMARCGGLGVIHRFMSAEEQANQVSRVKRAQATIVVNPIMVTQKTTFKEIKELSKKYTFQTFLVTDEEENKDFILSNEQYGYLHSNTEKYMSPRKRSINYGEFKLVGILTKRDIKNFRFDDELVEKYMTKRQDMAVVEIQVNEDNQFKEEDIGSFQQILEVMYAKRIEKIPIVSSKNAILGLITRKDIERQSQKPISNKDSNGQLLVAAAIGANKDYIERAQQLASAGCNALVVDVANGHSTTAINAVKKLKDEFPKMDIIAGSIATGEGALKLIEAGADGIRCGIGNGSICITRIVAGSGVPQLSALMDVAPVCKEFNVPLISDGGNKCSGNMAKALASGADCVMVGRLVAGTDESPSTIVYRDGKLQKVFRGMAGYGANLAKAKRTGEKLPETDSFTPEGVEGYTPYSGPLSGVIGQFVQGIKSGMSYSGAFSIKEFQKNAKFIRITQNGVRESNVHGVNKI